MNRLLNIIALCASCLTLCAQQLPLELSFRHYTMEEGLPSNGVHCFLQDMSPEYIGSESYLLCLIANENNLCRI